MRKTIIFAIILLLSLSLSGCKPESVKMPAKGILPSEPARYKTSAMAEAYIDAIDYSIRNYANREEIKKTPLKYISFNVDKIAILSDQDKKDIVKFIKGYGIQFDQRGIGSGRSIKETQEGIEMDVIYNPEAQYYVKDADLVIQVKIYKGQSGRGYFASFKLYRGRYIPIEIRDWESYPYR